jgi:alpha-glucosidase
MRKLLLLTIFATALCVLQAREYKVVSPDKKIELTVNIDDEISWSATYDGKTAVENAVIAMQMTSRNLGESARISRTSSRVIDQIVEPVVPHKFSKINEQANELTIRFRDNFNLVFRAYNDGIAYRFVDTGKHDTEVFHERMDLNFPTGTISYFPEEESIYSHNERFFLKKDLLELGENDFCSMPLLFKTNKGINVLFNETAVHDYPRMFMKGGEGTLMQTQFPKYVLEAVANVNDSPDRNEIITKEANYIAKVEGSRDYPWRVFIIGESDAVLVESKLNFLLAEPNVIENPKWIKPGKVAWDWYNANNIYGVDFESGLNTETYKYYIDFASENGIEYVILDEGWTKSTTEILDYNPDIDVPWLIEYANSKNVDIILWVLWKPLDENTVEILELYKKWGAAGIKVDFMQRSDQYMVSSYERIAREAARLEMLVNYHGAFPPAGLHRKYPNLINYEAVKGSENNKWSDEINPPHNVTIPYTRMAAGPMDYTPGAMINARAANFHISHERPMSLGTRCHQVAMYVIYEAPMQMMCESPSTYRREQETVDFITQIPTVWDETIFIDGKVGEYIVLARRYKDKWYVGAMTDWSARDYELDLSFLPAGEYAMELMRDGVNAHRFAPDYKYEKNEVSSTSKVNISMAPGGGWAAIISVK